jgi:hypothetical protein
MNTLTLSVRERLLLPGLLPSVGGRIEIIVVASLRRLFEFSAEEVEEYKLIDLPDGRVQYNPEKLKDKSITLTVEQVKILKDISIRLDNEKKVTLELLPLLDKIDLL